MWLEDEEMKDLRRKMEDEPEDIWVLIIFLIATVEGITMLNTSIRPVSQWNE